MAFAYEENDMYRQVRCLLSTFLATAALACAVSSASPAAADTGAPSVHDMHVWTVNDAPPGPWTVYLSGVRYRPGHWTGAHSHSGPEFGFVLGSPETRWSNGAQISVAPGIPFYAATGVVHEAGNTSDTELIQLTTHITTAGSPYSSPADVPVAPKQNLMQQQLYRVPFTVGDHPAAPFHLTMEILDFAAGMQTSPHSSPGMLLGVVVDGSVSVTQNGASKAYAVGEGQVPPSAPVVLSGGPDGGSVVVTAIAS